MKLVLRLSTSRLGIRGGSIGAQSGPPEKPAQTAGARLARRGGFGNRPSRSVARYLRQRVRTPQDQAELNDREDHQEEDPPDQGKFRQRLPIRSGAASDGVCNAHSGGGSIRNIALAEMLRSHPPDEQSPGIKLTGRKIGTSWVRRTVTNAVVVLSIGGHGAPVHATSTPSECGAFAGNALVP